MDVMLTDKPGPNLRTRLLEKGKRWTSHTCLLLLIFCLGCSAWQLADHGGDLHDPEPDMDVAIVTLGSYLIANQLLAIPRDNLITPRPGP